MISGLIYLLGVVLVNAGFAWLPSFSTPLGVVPLAAFVVGFIFVLRDCSQRAIGHNVLYFMAVGILVSFWLADPAIAAASMAAFAVSEIVDWIVYTKTKKPFRDRVLISSAFSVPLDSLVFLLGIGQLSLGAMLVMIASKMVAALGIWLLVGEKPKAPFNYTTFSGRAIPDILNIQPSDINIYDIAHSLSQMCRWGGHTRTFFSVAQHSLIVAEAVEDPRLKLQALLHDATEAYLIDLPTPLKLKLPDYYKIEAIVWKAICRKFGLDPELHPQVKEADYRALCTEAVELTEITDVPVTVSLLNPIRPMSSQEAEIAFLEAFKMFNGNQSGGWA